MSTLDSQGSPMADDGRSDAEEVAHDCGSLPAVTIHTGDDRATVEGRRLREMDRERIEREYLCASGERWGGVWRGVPVATILDEADLDIDGAVTHLRVVARGGYAVCVPVATALDAHLAVERDGDILPEERGPRFLARVDAGKTVKGVRELELLRIDPDGDPDDYENLDY